MGVQSRGGWQRRQAAGGGRRGGGGGWKHSGVFAAAIGRHCHTCCVDRDAVGRRARPAARSVAETDGNGAPAMPNRHQKVVEGVRVCPAAAGSGKLPPCNAVVLRLPRRSLVLGLSPCRALPALFTSHISAAARPPLPQPPPGRHTFLPSAATCSWQVPRHPPATSLQRAAPRCTQRPWG